MAKAKKSRRGHSAPPAGKPKLEMPKSGSIEMPAAFHEIADNGMVRASDALENATAATAKAIHLFQHTCMAANQGATDYNLKAIEIARTNTNTAFDYAHDLVGVKSLSEFIDLSAAHARKQIEAMIAQTNELTELARQVTIEIVEPLKAGDTKALKSRRDKRRHLGENDVAEMAPQEEVLLLHVLE
jgi:phasin